MVGSLSDFADRILYSVPMYVVGWPGGPTASCELGLSGAMTYESNFSAFHAPNPLQSAVVKDRKILAFWWFSAAGAGRSES